MQQCADQDHLIANQGQRIIDQEHQILELSAELAWYKEQFRLAQYSRFGNSREHTPEQQALVFDEIEASADPAVPEPTVETITYQRRKTKGKREAQLANLPVETINYELSGEEKICSACGGDMHRMSEQVRQELKIVPARITVVKHVQGVYACRCCERSGDPTPIITAPMPASAFANSLASPSAVAYLMDQKFTMGLPLYRLEQSFERLRLDLSRQTMANWMIRGAAWLQLVYDRLHHHLIRRDILHADDTRIQVLHEVGRKAQTDSAMWLYRTGRDGPAIVLFDYQTTRSAEHPRTFLAGFQGFLTADGHDAYEKLTGIVLSGCWAHARRNFVQALEALPASVRKTSTTLAHQGLAFCNELFDIERALADGSPEERLAIRKEKSQDVFDRFVPWLEKSRTLALPKSATGKAIGYCLNQWPKLTAFLKDGRLEIDNNRAERSIKPFVIGRKNWLFANTPKGAKASATIYSLVETAKENGLSPYDYLTYLFERLPNIDMKDPAILDALLPWSETLPQSCRLAQPASPTP